MAEILTLQMTPFVISDPRNFKFIGPIRDVMLDKVPLDNSIVRYYRKLSSSGVRPIPLELQKVLEEGDKPKRVGKRKAKAGPSKVHEDDTFRNEEEDTAATSKPIPT